MRNYSSLSPGTPKRRKTYPRRKILTNSPKTQRPSPTRTSEEFVTSYKTKDSKVHTSKSVGQVLFASNIGNIDKQHNNNNNIMKVPQNMVMFPLEKGYKEMVISEAKAVLIWIVASCTFQIILSQLIHLSKAPMKTDDHGSANQLIGHFIMQEISIILKTVSNVILSLFPKKLVSNDTPGFIYASAWLLLIIRKRFGVLCNVPIRITEMMLGRFTPREIAVIIPIHFVGASLGSFIMKRFTCAFYGSFDVELINYALNHSWLVDLLKEVIVNCAFCVSLLVIPEFLKLNHLPHIWLTGLVMYPIYICSVDSSGKSSAFAPNVIYALRCNGEVPLMQYPHMIGPILGGLLGGKIMCTIFPDSVTSL